MEKEKFYVSLAHLTCTTNRDITPSAFMIEVEPHKARVFQKLFNQIHRLEDSNALRAHIPYLQYHLDGLNHEIDNRVKKVYALIHEFGDDRTKQFVEQLPYFRRN
ncbi:transposase [Lysinibacillus sp. 54212]|uniref:transposase n=1 Tax=Lysinibacillus sp. 54212 TaxID=3119829 RepID=UPI002FC98D08